MGKHRPLPGPDQSPHLPGEARPQFPHLRPGREALSALPARTESKKPPGGLDSGRSAPGRRRAPGTGGRGRGGGGNGPAGRAARSARPLPEGGGAPRASGPGRSGPAPRAAPTARRPAPRAPGASGLPAPARGPGCPAQAVTRQPRASLAPWARAPSRVRRCGECSPDSVPPRGEPRGHRGESSKADDVKSKSRPQTPPSRLGRQPCEVHRALRSTHAVKFPFCFFAFEVSSAWRCKDCRREEKGTRG